MELSSTQFVPAPQQRVWEALNDPQILKACITGCESIEPLSDTEYKVVLGAKIGPVTARFKGKLAIAESNPPNSYSLIFEGQGGAAGFAKGGANVSLTAVGAGTELAYSAKAQIGGKLAQIGSRLVDSAAKKMADDFFTAFNAKVGDVSIVAGQPAMDSKPELGAAPAPSTISHAEAPANEPNIRRILPWAVAAVAVLGIAVYWVR
jgi:carbon monoxide dehydrogenase subunit G